MQSLQAVIIIVPRSLRSIACELVGFYINLTNEDVLRVVSVFRRRINKIYAVPPCYLLTYLLTPWCRVLLEKLLCS